MVRGKRRGQKYSETSCSNISRRVSGNNNGLLEITTKSINTKPFQDDCGPGLQDENLDFEPDGEIPDDLNHTQNSLKTTYPGDSLVRLWDSAGKSDVSSNATENETMLSSHRGEMIMFKHNHSEDGRQKEYINIPFDVSLTARTIIDSSSSSGSDGVAVISRQASFSQEGESISQECESSSQEGESFSQEFGSPLQEDGQYSDGGYDVTSDEEQRLLRSGSEASELVVDQEEIQASEVQFFRDMKILVPENKNFRITRKIRMWNRSYKPYPPPVRLCLKDLGYEDPCPSRDLDISRENSVGRPDSAISFLSGPQSAISVSSRPSSAEVVPPVNLSSFRVTFNLSEGNRQVEKPTQSIATFSSPPGSSVNFKMPLPPVKRPPSRPKKSEDGSWKGSTTFGSSKGSVAEGSLKGSFTMGSSKGSIAEGSLKGSTMMGSSRGSTTKASSKGSIISPKIEMLFKKKKKEDDVISIMASSLGCAENLESLDNLDDDLRNEEEIKAENLSESLIGASQEEYYDSTYDRARIENWIEKIVTPAQTQPLQPPQLNHLVQPIQPPQPIPPTPLPESPPTHLLPQPYPPPQLVPPPQIVPPPQPVPPPQTSLSHHSPREVLQKEGTGCKLMLSSTGRMVVNFRDIPKFFAGLCYHHYFSEFCSARRCTNHHSVSIDKYSYKCKNIQPDEVLSNYKFTLRFHMLLKEMYRCFVNGFRHHKMQNELISCISDFLSPSLKDVIDSTEALDCIIQALEETGLSFLDAIDMISYNVGFINHPLLADILVDLISRRVNIAENWETIKRISRARRQISPKIVGRILNKVASVYPPNKPLCVDIYNFIVNNQMTDLTSISEELITPLKTLAMFGDNSAVRPPLAKNNLNARIENILSGDRERFEPSTSSPAGFKDSASHDSDERTFLPFSCELNRRTPSSCVAPSSGSSNKSGSGSYNARLEPAMQRQETSRYVPQNAVRRDTALQYLATGNYQSPFTPPPVVSNSPQISNKPIFGSPIYRLTFQMDVSLHNLLPDSLESVTINEADVVLLNNAIKEKKGDDFLRLLENYRGAATVKNFVTMTVANLKGLHDNHRIGDAIFGLLESLARVRPDYMKETHIKGILEVVVFNLLVFLEKRCNWRLARKLLEVFYDWDSLISSKVFAANKLSPMGRYIWLAKLLIKDTCYHLAYEILQCPNLRLLDSMDMWPFFTAGSTDLDSRNSVLYDFFSVGYRYNIVVVADLYRQVFTYKRIYDCNAQDYFHPMLISLINEEKISSLKHFRSEVFYRIMDRNILRAFTIVMHAHLSTEEQFTLYETCCAKGIYEQYTGRETTIFLRTNMPDTELKLILDYYFYKVSMIGAPPSSELRVIIRLPEGLLPSYPAILQKSVRSIVDINASVRNLTWQCYGMVATVDGHNTIMTIAVEEIRNWLMRVRS